MGRDEVQDGFGKLENAQDLEQPDPGDAKVLGKLCLGQLGVACERVRVPESFGHDVRSRREILLPPCCPRGVTELPLRDRAELLETGGLRAELDGLVASLKLQEIGQ